MAIQVYSTYPVKIKHYNSIFKDTVKIYRSAVDFFIGVALQEWDTLKDADTSQIMQRMAEKMTHCTKDNPSPKYNFDTAETGFYKFPSYLRRAAISEALGKVLSYKSNLQNWEDADPLSRGKIPSAPKAGYVYPAMYRDNMYVRTDTYTAKIKVFIRNTWDWLDISFRKTDVDYILHYCAGRKECVPTLQKHGREWYLGFAFEESVKLADVPVKSRRAVAVDLGINNACVCSVMDSGGTVAARKFLRLPAEKDSLGHAAGRIKKAQRHGARKMPRLWARANGINNNIAVKTAKFIIDTAVLCNADVIVFEHLELNGKKHGPQKQKLHLWEARRVQSLAAGKAHRLGMRISYVNAWGTSRLAFDGSGRVTRGTYMQGGKPVYNYSICAFPTGKIYNCDLNASYNIGARYFIRETLKSLPATVRLDILAKVPKCSRRSTCTLSDLYSLNAALAA